MTSKPSLDRNYKKDTLAKQLEIKATELNSFNMSVSLCVRVYKDLVLKPSVVKLKLLHIRFMQVFYLTSWKSDTNQRWTFHILQKGSLFFF